MVSHLSGSPKERELVVIETSDITCVIKGVISHPQYNKLREQMSFKVEDAMHFESSGRDVQEVQIFDVLSDDLVPYKMQSLLPIFFENGRYEIIILPKTDEQVSFYHEFPEFRESVNKISRGNLLTGTLHFRNEVGLTSFEIRGEQQRILLTVILEVYPTKLDYKNDYRALLNEVNEEIYNLAYHFIKRTYLQGSAKVYKEPSLAEFYRLIDFHFDQYKHSIERIERSSHQRLVEKYIECRGDQLRRANPKSLAYLRKNAGKFIETDNGILIDGKSIMPVKGLLAKKEHTVDTHENRYVKWTMKRIVTRLKDLNRALQKSYSYGNGKMDFLLISKLEMMIEWLERKEKSSFWKQVGKLDRSITSLVLQMATGYRTVLQVYTTISRSIVLQGQIYKMSIKDIATLYEYWTFLKLGQILGEKCIPISQDIVKVNSEGLFVTLDKSRSAERRYVHPVTNEEITLKYQYDTTSNRVPTVQQKPDSMLSIGKKGKEYQYQYVFDAKYRLDLETNPVMPGPMQEDINTMHRYRDSLVVNTGDRYERTAFGAYVLFPWGDEKKYAEHPLYRSIETVNIGAFPFLPNSTLLVSRFIDNLLNKSPEQLQDEGILPKGTNVEVADLYSVDYVLIITVKDQLELDSLLSSKEYKPPAPDKTSNGFQRIRYIAIYEKKTMQITNYAEVKEFELVDNVTKFLINDWKDILIVGNGYHIKQHSKVNVNSFFGADSLANLHSKNEEEDVLWRIVKRISNNVEVILDNDNVASASKVIEFRFDNYKVRLHHPERQLVFSGENFNEILSMDLLLENESFVFKQLTEFIYPL